MPGKDLLGSAVMHAVSIYLLVVLSCRCCSRSELLEHWDRQPEVNRARENDHRAQNTHTNGATWIELIRPCEREKERIQQDTRPARYLVSRCRL